MSKELSNTPDNAVKVNAVTIKELYQWATENHLEDRSCIFNVGGIAIGLEREDLTDNLLYDETTSEEEPIKLDYPYRLMITRVPDEEDELWEEEDDDWGEEETWDEDENEDYDETEFTIHYPD